jgi:hypothetical protein
MKSLGSNVVAILWTLVFQAAGFVLGENIVSRDQSHTIPAPVIAEYEHRDPAIGNRFANSGRVSQYWEGNDGPW